MKCICIMQNDDGTFSVGECSEDMADQMGMGEMQPAENVDEALSIAGDMLGMTEEQDALAETQSPDEAKESRMVGYRRAGNRPMKGM